MSGSGSRIEGSSPLPIGRSMASLLVRFVAAIAVLIGLLFIPAGRLDWMQAWLFVFGYAAFVLLYGLWGLRHDPALITSVNTFLSSMVRIQDDREQWVVTTGPYHWVRHPMYAGVIVFVPCVALILGSMCALVPAALIDVLFVVRTGLEDRTLQAELPGYRAYTDRVRYRLVPGVW
ncbi:MAG: isoprenylcysteine carboxylmethyltransferase family protein [Chloroflexi bacterium]|nr:isoprenylcysteine carboxylmethyltransferase family protein [Chloroflexota bacterium]